MSQLQHLSSMLDDVIQKQYSAPAEAVVLATDALDLAEKLTSSGTLTPVELLQVQGDHVTALLAVAMYAMQTGNAQHADNLRERALVIARESGDSRTIAKSLLNIGSIEVVRGTHTLARLHLEEALERFQHLQQPDGITVTQYNLAMLASREDRLSDALEMYIAAKNTALSYNLDHIVLGCLVSIGTMYEQQGVFEKALENYQEAVDLSRKLGDRTMLANTLANTATALFNNGHVAESFRFLKEAKLVLIENDAQYALCTFLNNQGATLLSIGNLDDSLQTYNEAIQQCESMQNHRERIVAYSGRAVVWLRMNNITRALEDAELAASLAESQKDSPLIRIKALSTLTEIHFNAGNLDKAATLIEDALKLDSGMETRSITVTLLELATKILERKKQYKRALHLHQKMHELYSTQHKLDSTRRMQLYVADMRVAVAERDKEILRLQNSSLREEIDGKLRELTAMTLAMAERGVNNTSKTGSVVWQVFDEQFSALNSPFTERLARRCPSLTATEMRVCALMKLGLGTKDAAQILHVTDRAIEKHRYNIRRKLGLDNSTNLTNWLEAMVVQS